MSALDKAEDIAAVERAVLSCVLLDARVGALLAKKGVAEAWFASLRCRDVYCAIRDAIAEGRPIDGAALAIELQAAGKQWAPAFIEGLFGEGVVAAHAEYYVDRLGDAYFRAELAARCHEALDKLPKGEETVDTTAARLAEGVAALLRWHTSAAEPSPYALRSEAVEEFARAAEDVAAGRPARALGLSWGIRGLDYITQGLYPGLHIIAARPSFGKTMLENYIACHHLKRGRRVARACLDMTPKALAVRGLTLLGGETLSKLRSGFMTASDAAKIRAACEASRTWHEYLLTEGTAEEIVSRARAIKSAGGLDLLTVDYVQLVGTTKQEKFMNDNMVISRAMKAFKGFANETGTPVILLSQLSRAVEKEDRAPQLSDLRDSGSIEQDAKTVTFVYPEPTVMTAWMQEQGVVDWKALDIRPGVLNVLKNQDGGTGAVAVRQFARYGIYEEAQRLTRDEMAAYRDARKLAALRAEQSHRRETPRVPKSVAMGYDFARAADSARYVVVRHPRGASEVFAADDLPILNAAAQRLGNEPWEPVREAVGLAPALAALAEERRRRGEPLPEFLPPADAPAAAPVPDDGGDDDGDYPAPDDYDPDDPFAR